MSGETDAAIMVKKSVLKLICSELSEHPTKDGVVRFTAPKTKLEPYPDYDEKESEAAHLIAQSAGTTFKKDKQFSSDEVGKSESDEFSEGSEGEENSEGQSASPERETTEEEEDDDGGDDEDVEEYSGESEDVESDPETESSSDGYEPPRRSRAAPVRKSSKQNPTKPDRRAYELSKRAPITTERAKYERGKLRRSERIKISAAATAAAAVAAGGKRVARSPVAKRANSKAKVDRSRPRESKRKSAAVVTPGATVRKRRAVVSHAGDGSAKQPRQSSGSSRVSKQAPVRRAAAAAGKIVRGYNPPDARKPRGKHAKTAAADDAGAAAANDDWAPGKPFPNCDTLEYFE
jgi:hypothetical protein